MFFALGNMDVIFVFDFVFQMLFLHQYHKLIFVHNLVAPKDKRRKGHAMLSSCKCRRQCSDKITEDRRHTIWGSYWKLDYQQRHDWLFNHIKETDKKQASKGWGEKSRRVNTRSWHMEGIEVCKVFFLHTLGYSSDSVISHLLKGTRGTLNIASSKDKRGINSPPHKFKEMYRQEIIAFIESHRPVCSHYRREHAPNRRYLPSDLSVAQLHNVFNQGHVGETCSYSYFHSVFLSLNISFSAPENDKCVKCEEHKRVHPIPEEHNCIECGCEECMLYQPHKKHASEAREALHLDTDRMKDGVEVATVDMQKVLQMPKVPSKDYFFSRKLVLFNETFACPGKDNDAMCILWHEGEAGRKAFNVANAYNKFVEEKRNAKEIILFLDNCNSQNKNWTLLTSLPMMVNNPNVGVQLMTLKYFEPGHTFMSADGVHGNIASAMKKMSTIGDMRDYVDVIQNSRSKMKTVVIDHTDMKLFKNEVKSNPGFLLADIKVIQVRRGSAQLFTKTSHSQKDFVERNILKKKAEQTLLKHIRQRSDPLDIPTMQTKRGIPKQKKEEIIKMCSPFLPRWKKSFFEEIPVNDEAGDLETAEEF